MGLAKQFECVKLKHTKEGVINFLSLQFSDDTFLFEIEPQSIDELFCHHFQTDQLVVVQGSMVLVCLQDRQYHYIPVTQHTPQMVKIPAGMPHFVINPTSEPCWVINAVIRHGSFDPKDYHPQKKPFPIDMDWAKKLLNEYTTDIHK